MTLVVRCVQRREEILVPGCNLALALALRLGLGLGLATNPLVNNHLQPRLQQEGRTLEIHAAETRVGGFPRIAEIQSRGVDIPGPDAPRAHALFGDEVGEREVLLFWFWQALLLFRWRRRHLG